ncbi:MAG: 6,7-dimethyl-8-ribityllumazine synthase [Burkholderiaceae bacterium]|nr:MAG: 6,7-dimethyl-8-ribityllumazine synthase [Betaproteobacteria bacterium TMED41]
MSVNNRASQQKNKKEINRSIAIVASKFNSSISEIELDACVNTLLNLGVPKKKIFSFYVPGALEIALVLKNLASSKRFDGLIALGAVIRGETFHFEIVAMESAFSISRVALEFNIPVANGILTVENKDQALDRAEKKGSDCALVVMEMINLLQPIQEYSDGSVICGKNS